MENNVLSVEALGKMVVFNPQNEPVKLSGLWQKETAVLIFVRHFG